MHYTFLAIGLFWLSISSSQELTIEQTLKYLNTNLDFNSDNKFVVEIKNDGNINIQEKMKSCLDCDFSINEYEMHYSEIHIIKSVSHFDGPVLEFVCNDATSKLNLYYDGPKCIYSASGRSNNISSFSLGLNNKYRVEKIYNAFTYLISKLKSSIKYNRNNDDDPFSTSNLKTKKSYISGSPNTENINLETQSGIYRVWVKIGTLNKHFVLDSGASEISLSKSVERELIDNGIIKKDDYIEPALFKLADGSIIECRRLIIPEMTIGDFKVKNVTASIGVSESPLLLGRSFLDNFRKWSIDNTSKELILEK